MRWRKRRLLSHLIDADMQEVFTSHFRTHEWGGTSVSGPGSDLEQTVVIRQELPKLVKSLGIRSILDAPCGDFNWMDTIDLGDVTYTGCDIVPDIIELNKSRYERPGRTFLHGNIVQDDLPAADLVICRDCFIHLPFDMALAAVKNFKRSGSKYLATTTFPDKKKHWDTPAGGLHFLNVRLPPFSFPEPLLMIEEVPHLHAAGDLYGDKYLGVWELKSIEL